MQNLFLPRRRPHKTSCPIVLDLILTFKDTPTSLESQLIHAYFCSDSGSFSMCYDLALVERLNEEYWNISLKADLSPIGWEKGTSSITLWRWHQYWFTLLLLRSWWCQNVLAYWHCDDWWWMCWALERFPALMSTIRSSSRMYSLYPLSQWYTD